MPESRISVSPDEGGTLIAALLLYTKLLHGIEVNGLTPNIRNAAKKDLTTAYGVWNKIENGFRTKA